MMRGIKYMNAKLAMLYVVCIHGTGMLFQAAHLKYFSILGCSPKEKTNICQKYE